MSVISQRPQLASDQILHALQVEYGIEATDAEPLPGERDQNVLVTDATGGRFVVKICNPTEPTAFLIAQNQAMRRVEDACNCAPRLILTRDGSQLCQRQVEERTYTLRVVSFLSGVPLAELKRPGARLLLDLGNKLGHVVSALQGFDAEVLHRDFDWNLKSATRVVRQYRGLVAGNDARSFLDQVLPRIEDTLENHEADLPQAAIHNDANDHNVIVSPEFDTRGERRVVGIIDFGDLAWSYRVAELAVAMAYVVCRRTDWLTAACELTAGFHAVTPLEDVELRCVWDLVLLRLCLSICMSAQQQQDRPDDAYLSVSQEPIRRVIGELTAVSPRFCEYRLRAACGKLAHPRERVVRDWITANRRKLHPVMGVALTSENSTTIDLSVDRDEIPEVPPFSAGNQSPALSDKIHDSLGGADPCFSIGRYNEARMIYSAGQFAEGNREVDPRRTIHLGVDVSSPAGTTVRAPLDGTVVVSEFRGLRQDYGGLVIVRHETSEGDEFFSLFGHLSRSSVDKVCVGTHVTGGAAIGQLGDHSENGGWEPHLHFQLILDLVQLDGSFPGVAVPSERAVWTSLSPNPSFLLGCGDELATECDAMPQNQVAAARRQSVGAGLSVSYRDPLTIVRGAMQYLWDDEGRKYLDAYNNVPHVGHCHPRVVEAAARQMSKLNTNTRYLNRLLSDYAERICETLPDPLSVCYFVNSASEANELALRLARAATGRKGVAVQESAYHGHTTSLIDVSPYKHAGPGGEGAAPWVHAVPLPDVYRGRHRGPDAGVNFASDAAQMMRHACDGPHPFGAWLAETCPSVAGQIIPPLDYLKNVYQSVREAGAVAIADEVQTGFGRMGHWFWAFEMFGVVPDMVVMGKPMGNGHPIAAVATTTEIAEAFDNGMEFFSTFGGNTVSCAVGLAVLDVLRDEALPERAVATGAYLKQGFLQLQQQYEWIGDVRGAGLFWGLELVRDRNTLEPAAGEASFIANRLRHRGVLLGTDGPLHNVLKVRPPMQFNQQDATTLIELLGETLAELK